ncbi:histone H1-like [Orussus abietinus]|uniref:histone H1-like n=1 Tax=Orussus abietinus TaxID=222816 RepID=UPI00062662F9|nr:histone H1-like [Orussus abietinus]
MADKSASPAVMSAGTNSPAVQATPKKAAVPRSKKPRTTPSHPPTSEMVNAAITNLQERGGSSFQAIKKYIATTYKLDLDKQSPFIKKYLKAAVTSGTLIQTKGKGATGSFKLAAKSETAKPKAPVVKASPKKATVVKKPAAVKKPAVAKKTVEKRKAPKSPIAKPKKAKATPTKSKATKSPMKKPKAPRPKKAPAKPKAAPKKAAAAKK